MTFDQLQATIYADLAKRLERCGRYLAGEIKRTLSVPAPRRTAKTRRGGHRYYVATTPATRGAPPRKLSGRLRASITSRVGGDGKTVRTLYSVVGTNVVYARRHEHGDHPFLIPTAMRCVPALDRIMTS